MTIPSFEIDHTVMKPGVYVSRHDIRQDVDATTYDIRIFYPNRKQMTTRAAHTLEHLLAVWLRNVSEMKDDVIYIGPMGCLTGFYLILWGEANLEKVKAMMLEAFRWVIDFSGEIPGASEKECGNYRLHSLPEAKGVAKLFIESLNSND